MLSVVEAQETVTDKRGKRCMGACWFSAEISYSVRVIHKNYTAHHSQRSEILINSDKVQQLCKSRAVC